MMLPFYHNPLTSCRHYLGDPEEIQDDNILRLLSVLLAPKIGDAEKKRILQKEFAIPMTEDFPLVI